MLATPKIGNLIEWFVFSIKYLVYVLNSNLNKKYAFFKEHVFVIRIYAQKCVLIKYD